jgi:hypothetical protein
MQLTDPEQERLVRLIEECSETSHMASKVLLHGWHSTHPRKDPHINNRIYLARELGDIQWCTQLLICNGNMTQEEILQTMREKHVRRWRHLHHPHVLPERP